MTATRARMTNAPPCFEHRREQEKFADESGERRQPGQEKVKRSPSRPPEPPRRARRDRGSLDVFVAGDVGDHADDQKCAEIHDQINHDVKQNRRQPFVIQHRQAHHHVTGMGDPRVGEHALEIALVERAEIADGHRDHAEEQQHMRPFDARR